MTALFLAWLYDQPICFYCGGDTPRNLRQQDHVIPIARGGKHDPHNLTMACRSCNLKKRARQPGTFIARLYRCHLK